MSQWKEAVTSIIQERNQEIVNAWNAGARIRDLVSEFNVSLHTLRKIIFLAPDAVPRNRGRKIGSFKPHTREIEERCRSGGESFVDIARAFGVSLQRVGQIANRAGVNRKHSHIISAAVVKKRSDEREKRAQAKAKRQAEKAALKAERQKLIDAAGSLRAAGKTWQEIKDEIGVSGSYYLRLHPEAREREFAPRRRGA